MMSLRAVNAGRGYEYLLRSVATNDARDGQAPSLSAYYQAKGTPPGRWLGKGLAGLKSEAIHTGAEITELQMAALYGEGIHPDVDERLAAGERLQDCFIGRGFPNFTAKDPLLIALRDAEVNFRTTNGRLPSEEERSELVLEVATPLFEAEFGTPPVNGKEVVAWVNARKDKVRQAVAGYDFTFSPVKSISVLWAMADEQLAAQIAACHHRAVAQALAWAEEEFIRTRSGAGGKIQVKTRGLIAAEFTHFDTRAGDPDLHSHVLVSNKVQDKNGNWKALDGRTIFRFHQAMSFRYNALIRDEITRTLGLDFEEHSRGEDKQPVWEIAGMNEQVLAQFSKRRAGAQPVFDAKVRDYVERTGATPSRTMMREFWQQAILETRDEKRPAQSLAQLREQWFEEALSLSNGEETVAEIRRLGAQANRVRPVFDMDVHADDVARETIELVTRRRSVFRRSHVHTALSCILAGYHFDAVSTFNSTHADLVDKVIEEYGLSLNSSERLALPEALVGEDGHGVDRLLDAERFTTAQVLSAETAVLEAVEETTAHVVSDELVSAVLDAHEQSAGWRLNHGQEALARHLVSCGTLVATGVGPAGTGKTASMKIVAEAWKRNGYNVHALAPSAAAAEVLGEDIGQSAHTIDSLTFTWRGKHPKRAGGSVDALGISLQPGDMLLVDEAGMVSTDNMAALVEIARAAGAVVRFVGDHKQLSSVENGGLFGALTELRPTVELHDVMRFGEDSEQAEASMLLRDGDCAGLDLYESRGWVHGGARQKILVQAAEDYLADVRAGRSSLVLASTNEDVATLNDYIRGTRIADGLVDDAMTVEGAAGVRIGVGETVIARKNFRFIADRDGVDGKVINGDLFTVVAVSNDGAIEVTNRAGAHSVLPAWYVRENVQLGYASTVHRAQGATVDVARAVVDGHTDRAGLYVALSRGKWANHAYVANDVAFDFEAEDGHYHYQGQPPAPTAREVLESVIARDTRERSALEALRDEAVEATSPERVEQLWAVGKEMIIDEIIERELPAWLATLSEPLAQQLREIEAGDAPIRSAWRTLLGMGCDPAEMMMEALADIEDAHDVGRLVAYRLRSAMPRDFVEFTSVMPPAREWVDAQLWEWMERHLPTRQAEPELAPLRVELRPGERYEGENFAGFDFSGADLSNITFSHCDFSGVNLSGATLVGATFVDCDLSDANVSEAVVVESMFQRCTLPRADFSGAQFGEEHTTLTRSVFTRCEAQLLVLKNAIVHAVEFVASSLAGMNLSGAQVNLMRLERCDSAGMVTSAETVGVDNVIAEDPYTYEGTGHEWPAPVEDGGVDFAPKNQPEL